MRNKVVNFEVVDEDEWREAAELHAHGLDLWSRNNIDR